MIIIPTILEKNFEEAERKIGKIRDKCRWISIDVIDGVFKRGKTFELELLNRLDMETDDLLWDIHLMVKEPINWVNKCEFVGAARVIGQVEMMDRREDFIKMIKDKGMEAGLAFDIETEARDIPEETDVVVLMARKAGWGNYGIDQRVWQKIEKIKSQGFVVGVDGGVNKDNIAKIRRAGAEIAYCGRAVFEGEVSRNLEILQKNANS